MAKYADVLDGEWFEPRMSDYRQMCCDCGLVHKFQFRKTSNGIEMRVWRDDRATALARRKRKK
jgi:hypothetical protein